MFRGLILSVSIALGVSCIGGPALFGASAMAAPLAIASAIQADAPAVETLPANPALLLEPLTPPSPETALFTLEETAVPFLGITEDVTSKVMIAVESPNYHDVFTIYFPRGTTHLTLAAEDMIALAAEATRDIEDLEIWIAGPPGLSIELAIARTAVVYEILVQNDVAQTTIRIDDGSVEAILNRPESLSTDIDA